MRIHEIVEAIKKTDTKTADVLSFTDEPEFQPEPEKGTSRAALHYKDVTKRSKDLQAAIKKVEDGEMSKQEYDILVNKVKAVYPYEEVPMYADIEKIKNVITKDKTEKVKDPLDLLPNGFPVGLRLDIPSYRDKDTWVVAVHEQKAGWDAGTPIAYTSTAIVSDATLGVHPKAAMKIAKGNDKGTIAVMKGNWVGMSSDEAKSYAEKAMKNPAWKQVGMDPERHAYFYDRKNMQPIVAAEQIIQVGGFVIAYRPTYANKTEFPY
jgi:hypothetical protein